MTTTSTARSASIASTDAENRAPHASASARPRTTSTSTIQRSSASSRRAMLCAWMRPIVPAPITPKPIGFISNGPLRALLDDADHVVRLALPPVALRKDLAFDVSIVAGRFDHATQCRKVDQAVAHHAAIEPQIDRVGEPVAHMERADPLAGTDRKSTRLNSSHITISYAVFCLKKKKKI